ncbi:hypothetical protein TNCV_4051411 [Trichonephila clavipes]|nr:hypothetical protein TNCV_4051411 [Trichonephila clavipes]
MPHFYNVPSVSAGGFFKARQQGNTHNVLPGGPRRSQDFSMERVLAACHPQPRSSASGTAFGDAFLRHRRRTQLFRHILFPRGSFRCPNTILCRRG